MGILNKKRELTAMMHFFFGSEYKWTLLEDYSILTENRNIAA